MKKSAALPEAKRPRSATRQLRVTAEFHDYVRARALREGRMLHRAVEEIVADAMGGKRPWQAQD